MILFWDIEFKDIKRLKTHENLSVMQKHVLACLKLRFICFWLMIFLLPIFYFISMLVFWVWFILLLHLLDKKNETVLLSLRE